MGQDRFDKGLKLRKQVLGTEYVERSIGNGAFGYRGFKCSDGAPDSMWIIHLYGRMPIGGDPAESPVCAASWGVFITPKGHQEAA
jgi:hypothetical protein